MSVLSEIEIPTRVTTPKGKFFPSYFRKQYEIVISAPETCEVIGNIDY